MISAELQGITIESTIVDHEELERTAPGLDIIRQVDICSITNFVARRGELMKGKVLDYGAGMPGTCRNPEPYRNLIAGEYCPFDIGQASGYSAEAKLDEAITQASLFDGILCTQVLQFMNDGGRMKLFKFRNWIQRGGLLLMTYATNWDEVEALDQMRFTRRGMERTLEEASFQIIDHQRRAQVKIGPMKFPLGYGVLARAL